MLHVPDYKFIDITVRCCVTVAAKNVWQLSRVLLHDNQDIMMYMKYSSIKF